MSATGVISYRFVAPNKCFRELERQSICLIFFRAEILDKIHAGKKFTIRFRAVSTQEYLLPIEADVSEDDRRRRVLTCPLDADKETSNEADWFVEPLFEHPKGSDTENIYDAKHIGAVRLSSVRFPNEYLLAGTDELAKDLTRRKVYTWKETGTDFSGWGGPDVWYFIESKTPKDDRAAYNHFEIRNRKFNEDLFVSGDRFELDKRFANVYTCRNTENVAACDGNQNIWEVIMSPKQHQDAEKSGEPGLMEKVRGVLS